MTPQPACRTADPATEDFYRRPGEEADSTRHRYRKLKTKFCEGCPILLACRQGALDRMEEHGLWGGWSEWDREAYWEAHGIVSPREARRLQAVATREAKAKTGYRDGRTRR